MKNPNCAGCNVIETIMVLKFPQVQGSLQLARKVALDHRLKPSIFKIFKPLASFSYATYENEAKGLKILKILGFSRCKEGTNGDGAVNNPNPTGCNVRNYQCIEISVSSRLTAARKKG